MRQLILAAIAAITVVLAQPVAQNGIPHFNPPAPATPINGANTNAKRFEMGLPPLKPKAHRHRGGYAGYLLGTRVRSAPRAGTSPLPPVSISCNILASYANATLAGFVSRHFGRFGVYNSFESKPDSNALVVSFSYKIDEHSQLALTAVNGDGELDFCPYFGGIMGFGSANNSFVPGTYHYAYLGGTAESPPGSPAIMNTNSWTSTNGYRRDIETLIWSFNPITLDLSAQWINEDGSAPLTHIIYLEEEGPALGLTTDVDAVRKRYGSTDLLTFRCLPLEFSASIPPTPPALPILPSPPA